jgi:hypothetical protein
MPIDQPPQRPGELVEARVAFRVRYITFIYTNLNTRHYTSYLRSKFQHFSHTFPGEFMGGKYPS